MARPLRFSDEEKVECLNNYFTSITNVDDSNAQLPPFHAKTQNLLSDIPCNAGEIETLIKLLNPNKATRSKAISNRMLSILFNRSFREGIFAFSWKESNVLSLFKNGDKSLPSNYRPISLLSNKGKLQERIVFNNTYNYLRDNNLLYKYQSGVLPNHSTTYQLVDIYHYNLSIF